MANKSGIYKCKICGNVVEVIEAHQGELVCCGQSMVQLGENTKEDEGKEKHVPIIEIKGDTVKIKVGSVPHPMEEKHYIEMIEIFKHGRLIESAHLDSGDSPEVEFCIENPEEITARVLCNVHGLWVS